MITKIIYAVMSIMQLDEPAARRREAGEAAAL